MFKKVNNMLILLNFQEKNFLYLKKLKMKSSLKKRKKEEFLENNLIFYLFAVFLLTLSVIFNFYLRNVFKNQK